MKKEIKGDDFVVEKGGKFYLVDNNTFCKESLSDKNKFEGSTASRVDGFMELVEEDIDKQVKKQNSLWSRFKGWLWCYFQIDLK